MEMLAGVIFDAAGSYEAGLGSLARSFAQAVEEMLEMPAEPGGALRPVLRTRATTV